MTPVETASAGILSGLAIAVLVLGSALLGDPSIGAALSSVPMAMLAYQHRTRVVVAGSVAVVVVSAVAGGVPSMLGAVMTVAGGAVVGHLVRRGSGWPAALLAGLVLGLVGAALNIGMLLAMPETRRLILQSVQATIDGTVSGVHRLAPWALDARAERALKDFTRWSVAHWWEYVLVSRVPRALVQTALGFWLLRGVLRRLHLDDTRDPLVEALAAPGDPAPLPVRLTGVTYRYPDADHDALVGVDLALAPGETVALVGPNGSGKSTLAQVLAGAAPASGTVERPGSAGLGRPGGTALLAQRSELQLLGDTLADDVRWGCAPDDDVDVSALLELVGLGGREDDAPSTLSGGELQRLALAGALARRPALLVSDESTAMVDPQGRAEVMAVLRSLPQRLGTTVVHVTHDPAEAAGMSRMVRVEAGRVVADVALDPDAPADLPAPRPAADLPAPGPAVLTLEGVGHTYSPGTPWEHTALRDVDLVLHAGEGVLVTGSNGSGKSTLARVMAGLLAPSRGTCWSEPGKPMRTTVGRVALAMQFSRLQLRRPTVGQDILDAVDAPTHLPLDAARRARVEEALAAVGLPPGIADRSVDRLSGGQMRRVALAGLLATRPAVLVLDEPFAGLDAESREALTDTLEAELRRGLALVVITHDVHGLESVCARQVVLERGRLVTGAADAPVAQARADAAGEVVADPALVAVGAGHEGATSSAALGPGLVPTAPAAPPAPGRPLTAREELMAEIERRGGLPAGDFRAQLRVQMEAQAAVAARRPPRPRRPLLPRALPWQSPMTRLWPGTKLLATLAVSSTLLWVPRWPTIALAVLLVALACRVARVPRSVVPRLPFIVWWALLWGGISTAFFGGLEVYLRTTAMGLTVLLTTYVVLWTTRPDHLAPAFATLLRPLRLVGAPVDEWARTMSLSLRGLPTLTGELTALTDSSSLRGGWQRRLAGRSSVWAKYRALFAELGDTVTAALSASDRRATATGRAMTMRGGVPPVVRERLRLGVGDLVAVLLTTGVVVASVLLRDLGR